MHALACPRGRLTGRRLDVRGDYGAFPVWGWFTRPARGGRPAAEVHGCISPGALGLTPELADGLQSWADWQDAHHQPGGDPPDKATPAEWAQWRERGRLLAAQLAEETGATVVYLWPSQGCDPHCPECGHLCHPNR